MSDGVAARPFDGIIVANGGADHVVGGMRLVERAAFALARAGATRLLLLGPGRDAALRMPPVDVQWNVPPATWVGAAGDPIVVISATTVAAPATIAALAEEPTPGPHAAPRGVLWRADPCCPAALDPRTRPGLQPPADLPRWTPPKDALLVPASDATGRAAAERALFTRLGRSGDGWFTRLVDRRLSRSLTRLLLPTGIAPNVVTLASIAIGIAGGCCFARGTPSAAVAGALLFLLSTIVDGCDGEIARMTYRESAFGAKLDILGDNLVHLFLFGGIAIGLYARSGDAIVAALGWALLGGVLLAMASVYACVVRRPPSPAQRALYEAFASREFAYLLVVLTLAGRLDWFLWMSAIGTYVFALGLLILGVLSRR
ncbi:MAG: CDP-alcohol phosphatidyltransferase family protein [Deltaproteobacteria bacterium]|nr:CDP-alcohol phosphatidyltransferase family protein [Deltaproteobacteria bacterium]